MGMVKDPVTGLQMGSIVEKNFVTDPSFYLNRKVKVRTRNTSGDTAFYLSSFSEKLRSAYASNGYELSSVNDDFGLLIDVNVLYSGQVQRDLSREFSFLGLAGGGAAGAAKEGAVGAAAGMLIGATLGSIIGSFVTDDTYIIIAQVTFGEIKNKNKEKKSIRFSRSPKYNFEEEDKEEESSLRSFKQTHSTKIAVFAGGRNVPQSRIAEDVRQRIIRIVSDII
jgi:hypothetical protein